MMYYRSQEQGNNHTRRSLPALNQSASSQKIYVHCLSVFALIIGDVCMWLDRN